MRVLLCGLLILSACSRSFAADDAPDAGANGGADGGSTSGSTGGPDIIATQASVAVGGDFACVLRSTGKVVCWGSNEKKQLARASNLAANAPAEVAALGSVAGLAAGGATACAVLRNGTVWCWGDNTFGIAGAPASATPVETPVQVPELDHVKKITMGLAHACALREDGSVSCWGANGNGELAHPPINDDACPAGRCQPKPAPIAGLASATDLAAGNRHTCALIGSQVSCWGLNSSGALGHTPGESPDTNNDGAFISTTPGAASLVVSASALFAGSDNTCIIDASKNASCWGQNKEGQLGGNGTGDTSPGPVVIGGLPPSVVKVGPGAHNACALVASDIWCWGSTAYDGLQASTPKLIAINNTAFADVASSPVTGTHCALAKDESVYCWGENTNGQTGQPVSSQTPVPTLVVLP